MVLAAQLRILVKTFVVNMKERKTLEAQWKAQADFIEKLAEKYPDVQWSPGSTQISDCPAGWQPIVDDLFAVMNNIASQGVGYSKDGWIKRFTEACNRLAMKLRLPRKFRFKYRASKRWNVKPVIVVEQLKEKFAELRLYYRCDDPKADDRILGALSAAEQICSHTCQASGSKDGKLRTGGWWVVLSDKEYLKRKNRVNGKA